MIGVQNIKGEIIISILATIGPKPDANLADEICLSQIDFPDRRIVARRPDRWIEWPCLPTPNSLRQTRRLHCGTEPRTQSPERRDEFEFS